MAEQNFESHAHQPIQTFVAGAFTLVGLVALVGAALFEWPTLALGAISVSLAVAVLVAMSRTYITRLQDRIIMLEMKVRCAELLPPPRDALIGELRPKQIVALRFASDEELGELLERAVREKLPPVEIKRAIKRWRPDHFRT
jgi:uncharacterized protein DUF6526